MYLQNEAEKDSRSRAYSRLRETAEQQSMLISTALDGKYSVLEAFAASIATQNSIDLSNASMRMEAIVESVKFSSVGYADSKGRVTLSSGEHAEIADRRYFIESMKGNRSIEKVENGRVVNGKRFVISVPIKKGGAQAGIIFGSFFEEGFRTLLINYSFDKAGYGFIINSKGKMIIESDIESRISNEKNILDTLAKCKLGDGQTVFEIEERLATGQSGLVHYEYNGKSRFASYIPLGVDDWYLFNVVPGEAVQLEIDESNQSGMISIMILLAVSLALIAVIALITDKWSKDLRELQRMEVNRLTTKAESDSLTELLNHKTTRSRIERFIENEGKYSKHALFVIDLDGFKQINDQFGHPEGDKTISTAAVAIRQLFRSSDIVGRIGGDEFMALLKDVTSRRIVAAKAAEICEALHMTRSETDEEIEITGSVGVALYEDGKSFDQLYREADEALYQSKAQGKNRYNVYDT
ncbi:MAG: diguanylate cyclase [Oscillospiraceae bacterium]